MMHINRIQALLLVLVGSFLVAQPSFVSASAQEVLVGSTTGTCETDENGSCKADLYDHNDSSNENTTSQAPKSSTVSLANDPDCTDGHEQCEFWAGAGECQNNPNYMLKNCKKSCKTCKIHKLPEENQLELALDMGLPQEAADGSNPNLADQVKARIKESRAYMQHDDRKKITPELFKYCKNEHEKCTAWAVLGECDANAKYMKRNCAPACFSCEFLDMDERCKFNPEDIPNVWGPGDLNRMFEKLTAEPYLSKYSVEILSSPNATKPGPWVIVMENVLNETEAQRLIELGHGRGYKRSTGVGKLKPDGTHEATVINTRTSTNAWCEGECYEDSVTQGVVARLSEMTGIPETNSEYLQLLRYEPGQFYNTHHDCIVDHKNRRSGVRVITAYMYLNDVEGGGGTEFPSLGLTVEPKRGRMVVWPSVFDENPSEKDARTNHAALKVTEGIKYGANAWFHLRDYKTPHHDGCT